MTIKDFKVGQTAFMLGDGRRSGSSLPTEVDVVKVGRKYVTISGSWGRQFKETGTSRPYLVEHTEYGAPRILFPSREAVDEYCEREELKEWVRTAAGWDRIDRYTLAQLRAVKKILEDEDTAIAVFQKAEELDAAVADLESACASLPICHACIYCKNNPCPDSISSECDELSLFEWRGAQRGGRNG